MPGLNSSIQNRISISSEAETVRLIYNMYLQGIGSGTIAKRLVELGIKNKRGTVEWHDHGVMGMIKNEKYKGDVLLGKTFIVDPISKRRLANMGEENQYYIRDHHEAIVSREIWDKAEEIRLKRAKPKLMQTTGNRERYTRQFLADSFDDVLQSVLNTFEDILKADTELKRVKQLEKDISTIESKKQVNRSAD